MIECDEIVPVIIDPDISAGNLTETIDLIRSYNNIRKKLIFNGVNKNKFFSGDFNLQILPSVSIKLCDVENKKFGEYIGYNALNQSNKAMVSMLFSESNLSASMQVGFKGNPNIGSVVLNQFDGALKSEFKNLFNKFESGDRIFVISSIFGGTGASGFPLLVKNLRQYDGDNHELVNNAPIGAISVMPYFSVKPNEDSEINSSSFSMKTKAALEYYKENLKETNVLYYIGDKKTSDPYDNIEGGSSQKNDAHFIEMISALSIIDFMSIPIESDTMQVSSGIVQSAEFKEFGLKNDVDDNKSVIFSDFYPTTLDQIQKPLSQFTLFSKFLLEKYRKDIGNQPYTTFFDDNFAKSYFYRELDSFVSAYKSWCNEMGNNKRSFKPFKWDVNDDNLFSFVSGIEPKKKLLGIGKKNYDLYVSELNENVKKQNIEAQKEHCFIEMFYNTTNELLESELKMK